MSPNAKILREGSHAQILQLLNSNFPPTRQELSESLSSVVWREDYELIKLLLDAGADPNVATPDHMLPLMCAIEQLNKRLVELLIEHGANVKTGNEGSLFTPLHLAVDAEADCAWQTDRVPNSQIIELLLSSGADPTLKDEFGKTPLIIAQEYEFTDAILILSQQ